MATFGLPNGFRGVRGKSIGNPLPAVYPVRVPFLNIRSAVSLALLIASPVAAQEQRWAVSSASSAPFTLSAGTTGASELSGITWAGGNQWYSVSDDGARLFPVSIAVDSATGEITSGVIASAVVLAAGSDTEDVEFDAVSGDVLVSDETGPAIREHDPVDGSLIDTLTVPPVFAGYRSNLSLEALALSADGSTLWTANEEALNLDGPISGFAAGTTVRLQRFDSARMPTGQWAYVTDAIPGDFSGVGQNIEVSGVSDLLVLPDGNLAVLERALGGETLFRIRLYLVDLVGATDTSLIPALDGASFVPMGKSLLWERNFAFQNFEGLGLGPMLDNGGQSIVMVSDDGGGLLQSLFALQLLYVDETVPRTGCRTASNAILSVKKKDGDRDRLLWKWLRGSVADASEFGDPVASGGTDYDLFVYDSVASVPRLILTARIPGGAPWEELGDRGFKYKDSSGLADGVMKVVLKSGDAGSAAVLVKARGTELGLPLPAPGEPVLRRDTTVTVQLVKHDDPTVCFESTFNSAIVESEEQFKAKF